MTNIGKPFSQHSCGGSITNVPVATDGADHSPLAAAATLTVPKGAVRLNLLATGSNSATVVVRKAGVAKNGSITIPVNTQVVIECAGMNGATSSSSRFPDEFLVTPGATSPVSFWFDCITPDGE